jgi:TolA-binding protein
MKKSLNIVTCSLLFFSISCIAADTPIGLGDLINTMKGIAEQANKQQQKSDGSDAVQQPQSANQIDQSQQNSQLEQVNQETERAKQETERAKQEAVMAKQEAAMAKQEAEQAKQEAEQAKQEAEKLKTESLTNQLETSSTEATVSTPESATTITPPPLEASPEVLPTPAIHEAATTESIPLPTENSTNNSAIDQSSNLNGISFTQWLLYAYMVIATAIGTLFVRPPLMKWWNSQAFFVSGDNVVHIFFKQLGMRLTWETFMLAVSAVLGILGGAAIYLVLYFSKRNKTV